MKSSSQTRKREAEVGDYENVVKHPMFRLGSEFLEIEEVDEGWMEEARFSFDMDSLFRRGGYFT